MRLVWSLSLLACTAGCSDTIVSQGRPPSLVSSSTRVDFGAVLVGTRAVQALALSNPGDDALTFARVWVEGDTAFTIDQEPGPIAARGSGEIRLAFLPTRLGDAQGTLHFSTNGTPATVSVALAGRGARDETSSGASDAGVIDAAPIDAASVDAASVDADSVDADVRADAGLADALPNEDAETAPDASTAPDAVFLDATAPDALAADAAEPDAEPADSGTADAGDCTQTGVSPELAALSGGPYQNCQVPSYPSVTVQSNTRAWSGCCGDLVRTCAVPGYSTQNTMVCR